MRKSFAVAPPSTRILAIFERATAPIASTTSHV
jgi:hypothetical protein